MDETGAHRSRRPPDNKVSWATVAAIAAVVSTCGGALIALGNMMFASKDEHTELKTRVQEHNTRVDQSVERMERAADKIMMTVDRLNSSVIILNTRVEEGAGRRPR
jgi:hypothetical protein